jgi:mRNA interferase MazF
VIDQPRALDTTRFGEGPLTSLTAEEMAAVENSLKAVLGLG